MLLSRSLAFVVFISLSGGMTYPAVMVAGGAAESETETADDGEQILRKSPRDRTDEDRRRAILWLERQLASKPDDVGKLYMKLNLELALGRHGDAMRTSEKVVQYTDDGGAHLMLCMLRERLGHSHKACYEKNLAKAQAKGSEPIVDFNYLVALRMSDRHRFEREIDSEELAQKSEHPEMIVDHYESLLTSSREQIVADYTDGRRAGADSSGNQAERRGDQPSE